MSETTFDLLLHPVRMQITQALIGGRRMTAQELGERLPDVPTATLYRHLNLLVEGGLLVSTEERRARGPSERVFRLTEERLTIPPSDVVRATPADHMRYFTTFVAGLIGSFARYLQRPTIDPGRDGVSYRQVTLYLTDEELASLMTDLDARIRREHANEPGNGRHPRVFTRIVLPDDHPVGEG
jgi:DNA-binding transcriptional ArsR family regulator